MPTSLASRDASSSAAPQRLGTGAAHLQLNDRRGDVVLDQVESLVHGAWIAFRSISRRSRCQMQRVTTNSRSASGAHPSVPRRRASGKRRGRQHSLRGLHAASDSVDWHGQSGLGGKRTSCPAQAVDLLRLKESGRAVPGLGAAGRPATLVTSQRELRVMSDPLLSSARALRCPASPY